MTNITAIAAVLAVFFTGFWSIEYFPYTILLGALGGILMGMRWRD